MYHWILKPFQDLTPDELYTLIRLRLEVFVVEQNCVFQDLDNKDRVCYHLMGWTSEPAFAEGAGTPLLAAYARLVPPGVSYVEPSIGRVVTSPAVRGQGAGRALMQEAIRRVYDLYDKQSIKIGAQQHLQGFYGSLGFEKTSEMYLEDNIPHIEMRKK